MKEKRKIRYAIAKLEEELEYTIFLVDFPLLM